MAMIPALLSPYQPKQHYLVKQGHVLDQDIKAISFGLELIRGLFDRQQRREVQLHIRHIAIRHLSLNVTDSILGLGLRASSQKDLFGMMFGQSEHGFFAQTGIPCQTSVGYCCVVVYRSTA